MCRASPSASHGIRPRPAPEGQSVRGAACRPHVPGTRRRAAARRAQEGCGRPPPARSGGPHRGEHAPAARRARARRGAARGRGSVVPAAGTCDPGPPARSGPARFAVRGTGSRRRRPATRHCRHARTARPAPAPASPPPLPQHSQEQLEDSRKDQVVAAEGPAPAEEHHPRHGEGRAAGLRPARRAPRAASTPRSPGSAAKHSATPRRRARGRRAAHAHTAAEPGARRRDLWLRGWTLSQVRSSAKSVLLIFPLYR